jgi:hypothetical protein
VTRWHCIASLMILSLAGLTLGTGQAAAQGEAKTRDRTNDLRRVTDLINGEPDKYRRLANMEALIAENDTLKLQIAIRSALANDDPDLRALGMQAYISSIQEIVVNYIPDPEDKKLLDRLGAEERRKYIDQRGGYLRNLGGFGFVQHFRISDYQINSGSGKIEGSIGRGSFRVVGTRMQFKINFCNYELSPNRQMKLSGQARCEASGWPLIALEADTF